jgi:hypothetical protein
MDEDETMMLLHTPKYVLQTRLFEAKCRLLRQGRLVQAQNIRTTGSRSDLMKACAELDFVPTKHHRDRQRLSDKLLHSFFVQWLLKRLRKPYKRHPQNDTDA